MLQSNPYHLLCLEMMLKPAGARHGYEIHSRPRAIEGESMMSTYYSGYSLAGAREKRFRKPHHKLYLECVGLASLQ